MLKYEVPPLSEDEPGYPCPYPMPEAWEAACGHPQNITVECYQGQ